MRLSATGIAAPLYSIVQALADVMIEDNAGIQINDGAVDPIFKKVGANSAGANRVADVFEIPPALDSAGRKINRDALGRAPAQAGKMLLVPQQLGAGVTVRLRFLDPEAAAGTAPTDGPVLPDCPTGIDACAFGLFEPDGRTYTIFPWGAPFVYHYDIYTNIVVKGVAAYPITGVAFPARRYGGGAFAADGLAYLSTGVADDKRQHIYNPADRTIDTTTGPVLPFPADWKTQNYTGPVIGLPDGDVLYACERNAAISGTQPPWRFRPSSGAVTAIQTLTSSSGAQTQNSLLLTLDATRVLVGSVSGNKLIVDRLSDNALYDYTFVGVSNAASVCMVLLQNGKVGIIGSANRTASIVDPDFDGSGVVVQDYSAVFGTNASTGNVYRARTLSSGKVFIVPGSAAGADGFLLWQPFKAGAMPVPSGIRRSRYLERR